jgi:DnaJ-class molecular chaperone
MLAPTTPAQKRFAEITEAWEVLGNAEKRARYDQFGHGFQGGGNPFQGGGNPFQGGNPFRDFTGGGSVDLEDLFGGCLAEANAVVAGVAGQSVAKMLGLRSLWASRWQLKVASMA